MCRAGMSLGVVSLVALTFIGCRGQEAEPNPGSGGAHHAEKAVVNGSSLQAPEGSHMATGTRIELRPDEALNARLQAVTATCSEIPKRQALSCRSDSYDAFRKELTDTGVKPLSTLLAALTNPESSSLQTAVSARLIRDAYGSGFKKLEPGQPAEELVNALLYAAESLPTDLADRILPVVVHAAVISGRTDELLATTRKRTDLTSDVLGYVMVHGRLREFPRVRELVEKPGNPRASQAFIYIDRMPEWTAPEQQELCPWLKGALRNPDVEVQAGAANLLFRCDASFVDASLGWFMESSSRHAVDRDHLLRLGGHCRDEGPVAPELSLQRAKSPLCLRIRDLAEKVLLDEQQDSESRNAALGMLINYWPDRAEHHARLLVHAKDDRLMRHATRYVASLPSKKR